MVQFCTVAEIGSTTVKSSFVLKPKGWFVIGSVACLLVLFGIYSGQIIIPITAFCTAGIAAFDSMHINLRRYRTGISYGPVGLFVASALIWPLVLIWYFIVRVRIARGTMPLKEEFEPAHNLA
jgi:hypothetical protein